MQKYENQLHVFLFDKQFQSLNLTYISPVLSSIQKLHSWSPPALSHPHLIKGGSIAITLCVCVCTRARACVCVCVCMFVYVGRRSLVFIVLKYCIICIFLIHSDSLQIMSTALFKLVCNTQKSTYTFFFKYQGKIFLKIENILVSYCTALLLFFFIFLKERCQIFIGL